MSCSLCFSKNIKFVCGTQCTSAYCSAKCAAKDWSKGKHYLSCIEAGIKRRNAEPDPDDAIFLYSKYNPEEQFETTFGKATAVSELIMNAVRDNVENAYPLDISTPLLKLIVQFMNDKTKDWRPFFPFVQELKRAAKYLISDQLLNAVRELEQLIAFGERGLRFYFTDPVPFGLTFAHAVVGSDLIFKYYNGLGTYKNLDQLIKPIIVDFVNFWPGYKEIELLGQMFLMDAKLPNVSDEMLLKLGFWARFYKVKPLWRLLKKHFQNMPSIVVKTAMDGSALKINFFHIAICCNIKTSLEINTNQDILATIIHVEDILQLYSDHRFQISEETLLHLMNVCAKLEADFLLYICVRIWLERIEHAFVGRMQNPTGCRIDLFLPMDGNFTQEMLDRRIISFWDRQKMNYAEGDEDLQVTSLNYNEFLLQRKTCVNLSDEHLNLLLDILRKLNGRDVEFAKYVRFFHARFWRIMSLYLKEHQN